MIGCGGFSSCNLIIYVVVGSTDFSQVGTHSKQGALTHGAHILKNETKIR